MTDTTTNSKPATVTPIKGKVITGDDGQQYLVREDLGERVSETTSRVAETAKDKGRTVGNKVAIGAVKTALVTKEAVATVLVDAPMELGENLAKGTKALGRGLRNGHQERSALRAIRKTQRATRRAAKAQAKAAANENVQALAAKATQPPVSQ